LISLLLALSLRLSFAVEVPAQGPAPAPVDSRLAPVDTPGLEIEAVVGLGQYRDSTLPTPFVLTAANRTGDPITGAWEIEEYFDDMKQRSKRVLSLQVSIPASTTIRSRFSLALENRPLTIRLRRGRELYWQRTFSRGGGQGLRMLGLNRNLINLLAVHPHRVRLNFVRNSTERRKNLRPGPGSSPPLLGTRIAHCCSVRAWELPNCAPPLFAFRGLIFSPDADTHGLGRGQLTALADYLLWGGVIVVPTRRADLIESLYLSLPAALEPQELTPSPPHPLSTPELRSFAIGAGRLITVDADLFKAEPGSAELLESVTAFTELEPEPGFPRHVIPNRYGRRGLSSNAMTTLSLVSVLFVLYALMTGPVVWVFFRKAGRKVLGFYISGTVGAFCVLSLIIGPVLGLYRGDVEWTTVTELTPQGGIQWGLLTLTSAGARKHRIELDGERARAYLLPTELLNDWRFRNRYRWGYHGQSPFQNNGNVPFDVYGGSAASPEQHVPISPWGSRLLLANAYWSQGRSVDVRVELNAGKFDIEARNGLPCALRGAHVILGVWAFGKQRRGGNQIGERDFYQVLQVGNVAARKSTSHSEPANLQVESWDCMNRVRQLAWTHRRKARPGFASVDLPRVNTRGRLLAYLIARIDRSPRLKIKETNFDEREGVHFVVQRIPDSRLPAPDQVFRLFSGMKKQFEEQQKKARGN